jgi:hypothetical protein
VIPDDTVQAKYFLGDSVHSEVRIAVWGTPITGKPTPGGVVDYLKRPAQLGNDVIVGQTGHIRMGPSMHGDIVPVGLEGGVELIPILDDIHPNEEVSRLELILS